MEEAVGEQRAVQGEMLAQEAATPRPAQEAATPPPTPPQDAVRGEMFRRPLVPVVEGYVDGHVRRAMEAAGDVPSMQTAPKVKVRDLPLTGAVMSRLPHYRLLPRLEGRCSCPICQEKAAEYDRLRTGAVQPDVEAAAFRDAFSEDVRAVCCLAGHLHEHQSTCFKYAPEGSRRKPQHCRFNFTHFVSLPWKDEESGATRLRVVARPDGQGTETSHVAWGLSACAIGQNRNVCGVFSRQKHAWKSRGDFQEERKPWTGGDCPVQST